MTSFLHTGRVRVFKGVYAVFIIKLSIFYFISPPRLSTFVTSNWDFRFDPRQSQTNDFKICICCFTTKQAGIRSISPSSMHCLYANSYPVSQHVLDLAEYVRLIIQNRVHIDITLTCFRPEYAFNFPRDVK